MKSEQFILVSVPLEMFLEAGINTESIIQVSARAGKIIIDTPDTTEEIGRASRRERVSHQV